MSEDFHATLGTSSRVTILIFCEITISGDWDNHMRQFLYVLWLKNHSEKIDTMICLLQIISHWVLCLKSKIVLTTLNTAIFDLVWIEVEVDVGVEVSVGVVRVGLQLFVAAMSSSRSDVVTQFVSPSPRSFSLA